MPKWISILLVIITLGQAIQPAFAGECCSAEMEMTCGLTTEDDAEETPSCCSSPATDLETPDEDQPHDCGDECQCFCCMHVVFEIPQLFEFQSAELSFPELSSFASSYSFQISFSVFQPPRLA